MPALLGAVLQADDQSQAGPGFVDRADFVVHEIGCEREIADDVFRHVGLDAGFFDEHQPIGTALAQTRPPIPSASCRRRSL